MQKKKKLKISKLKQAKGITLIALVITIIVLLILAGVTISLTIGENGIFKTAQLAAKNYTNAQEKETYELGTFENDVNDKLKESGSNSTTTNIMVTSIEVASTVTSIKPEESTQLVATILPENSTNKAVKWESSNADVAIVTEDGTVTAVAEGTATITVTAQDGSEVEGSYTIKVEIPKYTIKYDANGGTGAPATQTAIVGENTNISSTIPTYTCGTFAGWKVGSDTLQAGATYNGTKNVTLVAQWKNLSHNCRFINGQKEWEVQGWSGDPQCMVCKEGHDMRNGCFSVTLECTKCNQWFSEMEMCSSGHSLDWNKSNGSGWMNCVTYDVGNGDSWIPGFISMQSFVKMYVNNQ